MKKMFKGVLISALFFQALISTTEGAPRLFVDFKTTNSSVDSIYDPAKDSTFTAAFYVSGIEDLYGYQFYVVFDTTKLRYISTSKATSSATHLMNANDQFFFQSNRSIDKNDRILIAACLSGQIPGVTGSGYLGVMTFQRLTADTTSLMLAEPTFLNSLQSNILLGSLSNGLLLPPGSISVKQKRQQFASNYNIQISNRTVKVTSQSKTPVQIRLIDVSGRSIFEKKNVAQRFSFNIPQATSGIYMLSITNHNGSFAYPVVLK